MPSKHSQVASSGADPWPARCSCPWRTARKTRMTGPGRRAGLSLLEVVLALAILALATAYLAQSMELATTNALKSQRLAKAELVAESVMNQVVAGLIPAEPVSWTPYYNSTGLSEWMYQLQQVPTEVEGMLGLQVAVQQVDPNTGVVQTYYDLYANRWIIDPELMLDTPPEEEETDAGYGGESSGGSSGQSGNTSSTGPAPSAGGPGYGGGNIRGGGNPIGPGPVGPRPPDDTPRPTGPPFGPG